ncbi:hypothetical protein ACFPN2_17375 [Steroidobacter flavus]|uniref:Uncharacterized protein n=1 Tax=Steroidobacter flavus TaxID=1842136 RepID=A0ABV8SU28_9GAMM
MPRKRSPVGIAVGKLILVVQKECEVAAELDAAVARKVMDRARTLLQAAQTASVLELLDGRSVAEYLDPVWVEMHPSVGPGIAALVAAVSEHEARYPRADEQW